MTAIPVKRVEEAQEAAIPGERVLTLPRGLIGFKGPMHFAVLSFAGAGEAIKLLQCVQEPRLAFTLVDPRPFFADYQPRVSAQDLAEVDLERAEDGIWMCIATVPQDFRQATVNLRAPLFINAFRRVAKQVVLVEDLPVRQPLFRQ